MSMNSAILGRARVNHALQDVWASLGALPTGVIFNSGGGSGLSIRGEISGVTAAVHGLSGSVWSALASYPTTGQQQSSCGITSTAILAANGEINSPSYASQSKATFSFNGTSWATEADDSYTRSTGGMGGTASDAINVGGVTSSTAIKSASFFDGTSWAAKAMASFAVENLGVCGTSSSTILKVGGISGGTSSAKTETFNGTSWTTGSDYLVATTALRSVGNASKALAFGGTRAGVGGAYSKDTHYWFGGVWSVRANMLQGRINFAASGTSRIAIAAGGEYSSPARLALTERYS